MLAGPQRGDGRLGDGVHREVVAAEALDGEDAAGPQLGGSGRYRVADNWCASRVGEHERRSAVRTADRLGVEPTVARVGVLPGAGGTQRVRRHGGGGPVVGHVGDDREPRPAVGAVDERVAEAAVGRVDQLAQAVDAGRGVRRDQRPAPAARGARRDDEAAVAGGRHRIGGHPLDDRQRRSALAQRGDELPDGTRRSLRLGKDAVDVVAHEARHPQLGGQRVHERPVPDALDDALDPHPDPGAGLLAGQPSACCVSSHSTWYVVVCTSWMRCTEGDGTTNRCSMVSAAAIRPARTVSDRWGAAVTSASRPRRLSSR